MFTLKFSLHINYPALRGAEYDEMHSSGFYTMQHLTKYMVKAETIQSGSKLNGKRALKTRAYEAIHTNNATPLQIVKKPFHTIHTLINYKSITQLHTPHYKQTHEKLTKYFFTPNY
jgi:hypothetical protein